MDQLLEKAGACETHVVAAFVTVAAYRGNVALGRQLSCVSREAQRAGGTPIALISLGIPYLLRSFPWVSAYLATYSPAPTSETAAAKAILGAYR